MALTRSEVVKKSAKELAKYVIFNSPDRALHTSEVYVSFSLGQASIDIGARSSDALKNANPSLEELDDQAILFAKSTIQREWQSKTKFKFHFLEKNTLIFTSQYRYTVYIFRRHDLADLGSTSRNMKVLNSNRIFGRIIYLGSEYFQAPYDNVRACTILHEFGHALGLKHPLALQNDDGDQPPFANIDCKDTIMTYPSVCGDIRKALMVKFDIDPKTVLSPKLSPEIWNYYLSLMPSTIGRVDIAAANQIVERLGDNKKFQSQGYTLSREAHDDNEIDFVTASNSKLQLFGFNLTNPLTSALKLANQLIDDVVSSIESHINDTVASCPSYFPKDQPTYWRNKHTTGLFFGAAKNATACQVLPASSVCYLGK